MACSVVILSLKSVRPAGSRTSSCHGHSLLLHCLKTAGLLYEEPGVKCLSKTFSLRRQDLQATKFGTHGHAERSHCIINQALQLQAFDSNIMKRTHECSSTVTSDIKVIAVNTVRQYNKQTSDSGGLSSDTNIMTEEVSSFAAVFKNSEVADDGSHSKTPFDITKRVSRRHVTTSQQKHTAQNTDRRSGSSCSTVTYECGLPSYWEKSVKIPSDTTFHAQPGGSQVVSYPLSSIQAKCTLSSAHWSPVRQCHTTSQIIASTRRHQLWAEDKIDDGEQAKNSQKQKSKDDVFVEKKSSFTFPESKSSVPNSSDIHEARCSEVHFSGDTGSRMDESEKWNLESYFRKLEQLPRRWEDTWFGKKNNSLKLNRQKKQKTQNMEFTIMTYNILAQQLLEDHHHLYASSSPSATDWNLRRRRLVAEISYHQPDIVNLQEVQSDDFKDYLLPELEKLGYAGIYEKRKGDTCDGCATLWQTRKFRLLRSTPVDYCRGGLLDRNNIALLVELQPCHRLTKQHQQEGEDRILVANTHILFNPRRGDIKLGQLMVLLAEIDKHAYLGPREVQPKAEQHSSEQHELNVSAGRGCYCPVIITGDFNMEPYCQLYKFLITGYLQYEGQLIRAMSGQEEGQYGNNRTLEQNFFSSDYGIGHNCQYSAVVQQRAQHHINSYLLQSHTPKASSAERSSMSSTDSSPASGSSPLSENSVSPTCGFSDKSILNSAASVLYNSGRLMHSLNLVSAYRHTIERLGHREEEITTHHGKAQCTVDYIFYTVASKEVDNHHGRQVKLRQVKEGCLKLLARYGLMSARELGRLGGIPNTTLASDHSCLIAKFLLT